MLPPPTLLRCLRSPQGARLWWEAARLRTSARTSLKATRGKSLAYSGVWAISRSWPTARLRRRSLALARAPRSASYWAKLQRQARERSRLEFATKTKPIGSPLGNSKLGNLRFRMDVALHLPPSILESARARDAHAT